VTIRRIKNATKGGNEVVVRVFKDWKVKELGGFLCLLKEPNRQNCIFSSFSQVRRPCSSDISALSSLDSRHAFHPGHGKIKVDLCWPCHTSSESRPPPIVSLPTTTNTRVHVRSHWKCAFTLSPFDGLAVRPPIVTTLSYILAVQLPLGRNPNTVHIPQHISLSPADECYGRPFPSLLIIRNFGNNPYLI
jgi:hypothetical protein